MTTRQLRKLCYLVWVLDTGQFKHEKDEKFIKWLSCRPDSHVLRPLESERLAKVYLDNEKAVKRLEGRYL